MMRPAALLAVLLPVLAACQKMESMPRYNTYAEAPLLPGGSEAQPEVAGTVAREESLAPRPQSIPGPVTAAMLERGQQRFNIFCAPCHSPAGDGDGMVVRRGFPRPPTFHQASLRRAPDSHFYDVITNGYGAMFSYASRVSPADRWAIIAYIRALQLSRNADVAALDPALRGKLEALP
jgi:mono/diheme cytochrome c family protein